MTRHALIVALIVSVPGLAAAQIEAPVEPADPPTLEAPRAIDGSQQEPAVDGRGLGAGTISDPGPIYGQDGRVALGEAEEERETDPLFGQRLEEEDDRTPLSD
ncbi:MAG: hypothetical protein AAF763_02880 [Pseudomonadota bacterium]